MVSALAITHCNNFGIVKLCLLYSLPQMDGQFQKDCKYPTCLVKGHRKKRRNARCREWPIQNIITPFFKKTYTLKRVDILLHTPWFSNAAAVYKTFRIEEGVASNFIVLPLFLFKLLTMCRSIREFYFWCTQAAVFWIWATAKMKWGWQSQKCCPLLATAPTEWAFSISPSTDLATLRLYDCKKLS